MTEIKISQLSQVSASTLTDLFEVSRSLGSGNWESRSINYHNLLHSIYGTSIVTVGASGAMYTTIKAAIDYAITLLPSVTNPIVIQVQPGVYTEVPLTLPDYVALISDGDDNTTYIKASTATSPILTVANYSTVCGFYFQNASGVGGAAVKGTGVNCVVASCASSNCKTGFWANGSSASMRCVDCAVVNSLGQTCTYGFLANNGAIFTIEASIVNGVAALSLITNGFYAEGSGSKIFAPTFFAYYCANGIEADNGAVIDSDSGYIKNCTNAIRIGSTGISNVISIGTSIEDSTQYDILIESIGSHVDFSGVYDASKRSIVSGAEFHSIAIDTNIEGTRVTGPMIVEEKVDIGIPGNGGGIDAGEGGSYRYDELGNEIVEYWKYDESAVSGSRFTRYANNAGTQLTSEGDAVVVGSKFPFSAISLSITTAANVGSNNIVTEHWNGTDWTTDAIAVYKKSDMTHRANVLFQNVETQYVECGTAINDDWEDADNVLDDIPNWDAGISMYPVRFRNNAGALTTAMVFNSGKVRGDDFDVKGDAKETVNWGRFRKTEINVIPITFMEPNAVNPPQNVTVDISPNISNVMQASFTDGNVCATTFHQIIPTWADTSSGITLNIAMYALNAAVGNVNIVVRYLPVDAGFIFDGTATEYSASLIQTTYGIPYLLFAASHTFDISGFSPSDSFTVSLERDATAGNPLDTYAGDIVITGVQMIWTKKIV